MRKYTCYDCEHSWNIAAKLDEKQLTSLQCPKCKSSLVDTSDNFKKDRKKSILSARELLKTIKKPKPFDKIGITSFTILFIIYVFVGIRRITLAEFSLFWKIFIMLLQPLIIAAAVVLILFKVRQKTFRKKESIIKKIASQKI